MQTSLDVGAQHAAPLRLFMLRPYTIRWVGPRRTYRRRAGAGGGGGAVGSGESLFQISSTMSHFPFCCAQRTMYLPESAAGVPGGSGAPVGQAQCQRPRSTARGPLPTTDSPRSVRVACGPVFIVAKNARIASLPCTVAMFGGM